MTNSRSPSSVKTLIHRASQCDNEENLKIKWLVPILDKHFDCDEGDIHYEKKILRDRLDVRLMFQGRTRCAIELKGPSIPLQDKGSETFQLAFSQAHKYAHAFYVRRKGRLFPIQGILTNGHIAWLFDGSLSLSDARASAEKVSLSDSEGYARLFSSIQASRNEEPHPSLARIIRSNDSIASSADYALGRELLFWYDAIYERLNDGTRALELTLQLYLIAICRDCGFVPTSRIQDFERDKNWNGVVSELSKLFSNKFISLPRNDQRYLWELYDRTRSMPVRLDMFPADALGTVYERLIRKIKGDSKTKTSFYTPIELVDQILNEVSLKAEDRVLDPTAGSAAFLVACVQRFFPGENDYHKVKKYIETRIVGFDVDPYACIIAKASILSAYATALPFDPVDDLHIPEIKIHHQDFFSPESLDHGLFDVVIGNPPWGSIDSKKVLNDERVKKSLNKDNYAVYKDKSDICIFVFERSFNLLRPNGRIGMVCKLQTTYGSQHKNFVKWWNGRVSKIIDYGDELLFNNTAQTAIIIGDRNAPPLPEIVERSEKLTLNFQGKEIGEYFVCTQGWQSANDPVYLAYAREYPNDSNIKKLLTNGSASFFNIKRSSIKDIAVVIGDGRVSDNFKNWVDTNHPELKKRKGCSYKYGWKRTYHKECFIFDGSQTRLVVPRVWSNKRIPTTIDAKGELCSITSLTVLIPKADTPIDVILLTAAWMSSKYFVAHARDRQRCKPMGNGGLALYPAYLQKCSIPDWNNRTEIVRHVRKIMMSSAQPTNAQLERLDELIGQALLGLKADGIEKLIAFDNRDGEKSNVKVSRPTRKNSRSA